MGGLTSFVICNLSFQSSIQIKVDIFFFVSEKEKVEKKYGFCRSANCKRDVTDDWSKNAGRVASIHHLMLSAVGTRGEGGGVEMGFYGDIS